MRSLKFEVESAPSRAAIEIFFENFVKRLLRFASTAAFCRFVVAHFEWPLMCIASLCQYTGQYYHEKTCKSTFLLLIGGSVYHAVTLSFFLEYGSVSGVLCCGYYERIYARKNTRRITQAGRSGPA